MTTKVTKPHTGDQTKPQKNAVVAAMPLDFGLSTELVKRNADVNDYNLSGKKEGAALVTESCEVILAQGARDQDPWDNVADSTSGYSPTGAAKTHNGTIGDMRRKATQVAITSLSIPVVEAADLSTASSDCNTSYLSGKRLGAVVTTDGKIFIAAGDKPTDKWLSSDGSGSDVTPTGNARPDLTSAKVGDSKRKSYVTDVICCVDFPVVEYTQITDKDSALNTNPLSGKIKGAAVISSESAGSPALYIAKGDAATDKWLNQTTNTDVTPA